MEKKSFDPLLNNNSNTFLEGLFKRGVKFTSLFSCPGLARLLVLLVACTVSLKSQNSSTEDGSKLMAKVKPLSRSNPDSAIYYAKQALEIFDANGAHKKTGVCYNALAFLHYSQGRILGAKKYADLGYDHANTHLDSFPRLVYKAISNAAAMRNEAGNVLGAIDLLEQLVIDSVKYNLSKKVLSKFHQNLGTYYNLLGDSDNALFYLDEAQKNGDNKNGRCDHTIDLTRAFCYYKKNMFPAAKKILEQFISDCGDSEALRKNTLPIAHRLLGKTYLKMDDYEESNQSFLKSLGNNTGNKVEETITLFAMGSLCVEKGEYVKAEEFYISGVDTLNKLLGSKTHIQKAKGQFKLAECRIKLQKYDEALEALNDARDVISVTLETGEKSIIFNGMYSEILFKKAEILTLKKAGVEEVLLSFQQAIKYLYKSRNELVSLSSKMENAKSSQEHFEQAIKYCISNNLLGRALYWCDLSKAMTLNEQRQGLELIRKYQGDDAFKAFIDQQSDLHRLEMEYLDTSGDSMKRLDVQNQILALRTSLKEQKGQLQINSDLSFEEFKRTHLSVSVLEVFSGKRDYYFIGHMNGRPFANVAKKQRVDHFLIRISNHLKSPQKSSRKDILTFLEDSEALVRLMFGEQSSKLPGRLTIVPEGAFYLFPFDMLATGNDEETYRGLKYIFHETSVDYCQGLHLRIPNERKEKQHLLGIAPSFTSPIASSMRSCDLETLSGLKCNLYELEGMKKLPGSFFSGQEATRSNFLKSFPRSDVVHFATHACVDMENYYKSAIALSDDLLLLSELYELDWSGKKVILSACHTGGGPQIPGEGVFSFARALTEMGCSEVIVSLWPVDDCSTSKLFRVFYSNIAEGLSFEKALQKGKEAFQVEAGDEYTHPYYWSGFILFNNTIQPEYANTGLMAYFLVGMAMFFLLLVLSRSRRA